MREARDCATYTAESERAADSALPHLRRRLPSLCLQLGHELRPRNTRPPTSRINSSSIHNIIYFSSKYEIMMDYCNWIICSTSFWNILSWNEVVVVDRRFVRLVHRLPRVSYFHLIILSQLPCNFFKTVTWGRRDSVKLSASSGDLSRIEFSQDLRYLKVVSEFHLTCRFTWFFEDIRHWWRSHIVACSNHHKKIFRLWLNWLDWLLLWQLNMFLDDEMQLWEFSR